jgi:hypothetical protein
LFLVGCTASETRSLASRDDIPSSKYKHVAVFIENLDESERQSAEQMMLPVLQGAGVNAVSGEDFFKAKGALSEKQKAAIAQKEFDAVLYLTVLQNGRTEELVPNAYHNGQAVTYYKNLIPSFSVAFSTDIGADGFDLRPDGTVYELKLALHTKADLQDTKSAKLVWTSETIASGNEKVTNLNSLFEQASHQIVEKMRADNAI